MMRGAGKTAALRMGLAAMAAAGMLMAAPGAPAQPNAIGVIKAQQGKPPTGKAARDFTGVWMNDNTLEEVLRRTGKKQAGSDTLKIQAQNGAILGKVAPDVLTPEYRAIYDKRRAEAAKLDEGAADCHWPGFLGIMTYPFPLEFLHNPGRVTILFEAESQIRRIFLDRKEHLGPDDLDPTYNGDSIGHWEGDTLVVDTVGINEETTIRGLPHSDELRVIERIKYIGPSAINDQFTFTDRKAFKEPVVLNIYYSKRPGWRIREYSCAENNRSKPDAEGHRSGAVVK